MATQDQRIIAARLLETLEAAIETLPPDARPGPYVDPATCLHPLSGRFQFHHAPEPRRWYCEVCGSRVTGR